VASGSRRPRGAGARRVLLYAGKLMELTPVVDANHRPPPRPGSRERGKGASLRPVVRGLALFVIGFGVWVVGGHRLPAGWGHLGHAHAARLAGPSVTPEPPAGSGQDASLVCEARETTATATSGPAAPFRVMTYNVRHYSAADNLTGHGWMARRDHVIELVLDTAPDIVAFQEIAKAPLPAWQQPASFIRHRLAAAGYALVAGTGAIPEHMFYKTSRFSLEKHPMPESAYLWPDRRAAFCSREVGRQFLPQGSNRSASWCVLRDELTGKRLFVMNVHLASGKRLAPARVHQVRCLENIIARFAGGLPVVLLGDFNATLDAPELRQLVDPSLVGTEHLQDSGSPPGEGSFNGFCEQCSPTRKIDFAFERGLRVSEPGHPIARKFGGLWPSDHMPVAAAFEFPSVSDKDPGGH
jgi:endonuclease/exonuclease/phosphatase family metal-dependent hydrolase